MSRPAVLHRRTGNHVSITTISFCSGPSAVSLKESRRLAKPRVPTTTFLFCLLQSTTLPYQTSSPLPSSAAFPRLICTAILRDNAASAYNTYAINAFPRLYVPQSYAIKLHRPAIHMPSTVLYFNASLPPSPTATPEDLLLCIHLNRPLP
jgi:hypothetical protein